jgi:hypothetical protein
MAITSKITGRSAVSRPRRRVSPVPRQIQVGAGGGCLRCSVHRHALAASRSLTLPSPRLRSVPLGRDGACALTSTTPGPLQRRTSR